MQTLLSWESHYRQNAIAIPSLSLCRIHFWYDFKILLAAILDAQAACVEADIVWRCAVCELCDLCVLSHDLLMLTAIDQWQRTGWETNKNWLLVDGFDEGWKYDIRVVASNGGIYETGSSTESVFPTDTSSMSL